MRAKKPSPVTKGAPLPSSPPEISPAAPKPVIVPELPTSWDLRTHCGTCGEPKNVLLVHRIKVDDRIVEWTLCVSCQVRENRLAS